VNVAIDDLIDLRGGQVPHHEYRESYPRLPERRHLLRGVHTQHRHALRQTRFGNEFQTVSVGVGFHDGQQSGLG